MPILGIIASAYSAPVVYKFWGVSEEAVVASTDGISWDFKPSSDLYITTNLIDVGAGNLYVANNRLIMNNQFAFYSVTTDGTTWDYYNNNACAPGSNIVYQDSKYVVATGNTRSIGTSTDLITWTYSTIPVLATDYAINSLAYGNGTYVAVGNNNYCITSTNTITWTSRTTGFSSSDRIKSVVYGDKFVVVGDGTAAVIATSTDGITWTTRTPASGWSGFLDVTYDSTAGRYVAVGPNFTNDYVAQYSTDGITWVASTTTYGVTNVDFTYISSGNGTYVVTATGTINKFWTSTNGDTWTTRDTYNSENFNYLPKYFDSKWWFAKDYSASGGGSILVNTTNFTTWTVITGSPDKIPTSMANLFDRLGYMNGQYVAVSGSGNSSGVRVVFNSTNLVTWTSNATGFTVTVNAIFYGNGVYVAGGSSGTLQTSTDLVTWTTRTSQFGTSAINSGVYASSTYVIAGGGAKLSTSTNGTTWTSRTSTFSTSGINQVRYLNNLFVICGAAGRLATSTDAVTWTSRTSGVGVALYGLAYGASKYVYVGASNNISYSTDAVTWSQVTNPAGITDTGFGWRDASFNNNIFLVSGTISSSATQGLGNLYLTSTDGVTWTSRRNDKVGWYGAFPTFPV